jgi:hypothetical protein
MNKLEGRNLWSAPPDGGHLASSELTGTAGSPLGKASPLIATTSLFFEVVGLLPRGPKPRV